ncbi:SWIM-type domain-containing protein [Heracleum sosnowskyi]|uniref:SWIM-type domain-containing protein n=1 Tax=Heracleum sosnowskyi TaxID=360622 RepID=A0AAD8ICB8_9APIA|nr:SWIM-type domain-containing protein [Heracleum sosnowskyi]
MERVKKKVVLRRRDVCVISDRHKGIISVMNNLELGCTIKVARKLPITALVKSIFYKVVTYFDQRRLEIENQCVDGNEFTHHANKMLNRWKERSSGHHVKLFDRDSWVFTVTTMKRGQKGGNEQIVRLMEGICTCNKWQTFHIPCSHVLACCVKQNLEYKSLVSEWYRLDNARKVYGSAFEPLPDEDAWPLFDKFPMMVPDIENISNKPERKKEARYKNEMDFQVSGRNKGTSSSGASSRIP